MRLNMGCPPPKLGSFLQVQSFFSIMTGSHSFEFQIVDAPPVTDCELEFRASSKNDIFVQNPGFSTEF